MNLDDENDPKIVRRRHFMLKLLATGAFISTPNLQAAQRETLSERSIHLLEEAVLVNEISATKDTIISPKDSIKTGKMPVLFLRLGMTRLFCSAIVS